MAAETTSDRERPPFGIAHLTVVPRNFRLAAEREAGDREAADRRTRG